MTKKIKKTIQLFLASLFVVALTFGAGLLVKPQSAKAGVATEYTIVDAPMMGQIQDCYSAGGNLNFFVTLPGLDNEVDGDGITFDGVDLTTVFNEFGFFDNVMISGKTLRELGCTSFWNNSLGYNIGEPKPRVYLHTHYDPATLAAAMADGTVNINHTEMSTITFKEGTLIPGYRYLKGLDNAVVYRAGCDFETTVDSFAYERKFVGKTDVQSVRYIQDNGNGTGYLGVSLYGDDFLGAGAQEDVVGNNLNVSIQGWYYNNTVKLNGETGKVGYYSLVNLGSKGKGYYSFTAHVSKADLTSVTIPAGTKFPMYYYRGAQGSSYSEIGNAGTVVCYFETQTDKTFVKQGDLWIIQAEHEKIETDVTMAKAFYGDGTGNDYFLNFELSVNDYAGLNTHAGNAITAKEFLTNFNFISHVLINDQPFPVQAETYLNVWGAQNTFSTRGKDGSQGFTNATQIEKITILAGCEFPSYEMLETSVPKYYVTREDVTFIKTAELEWEKVVDEPTSFTVTYMVDGVEYTTAKVVESTEGCGYGYISELPANPTKADDADYTYTFKQWSVGGLQFNQSYKITSDITVEAEFTKEEKPASEIDVTSELSFGYQGQSNGTETYIIKTQANYWTKAPKGGCLNEYDPNGLGGGQEQMKYLYFNGTSLYDINKGDDNSYNSTQGNISSGNGIYAPILVLMGTDQGAYSYIQLHVPTGYPNVDLTANDNHQSVEIKAGFSVTENDITYVVSQDIKWINLNGKWVNVSQTFDASAVTFKNPRVDGVEKELYKVDIYSTLWNITCNDYDFMYANQFATYRQFFYINGVSVYDINNNTDDSSYVYSTSPMTGADDELFAHPVLIQTHNQNGDPNTITLWIHKNYIESLGDSITITLGTGYSAYTEGGKSLGESVSYDMIANVTVDNGTRIVSHTVVKGSTLNVDTTPSKTMTGNTVYTFDNWYITNTDTVYDISAPITEDVSVEARFIEAICDIKETEVLGVIHYLKIGDDSWLAFELSNHDYDKAEQNASLNGYGELLRIGFLDKVILKGNIVLKSATVSQATLLDVYNTYGVQEGPLVNFWGEEKFAIRVPVGDGVEEIVIESGCAFPSYAYVSGATSTDTRYIVVEPAICIYNETSQVFEKRGAISADINMEIGAAVRITSNMATSGLRFKTNIAKSSVTELQALLESGEYTSISFGTLIVPTDYLMGGLFTHDWLTKNGVKHLDIASTSTLGNMAWPEESEDYYSFFGSIVKLKEKNYDRAFSGLGYIKLVHISGSVSYIYARYDSANSRSAAFVAKAAIADRNDTETDVYENKVDEDNNWSPYTANEHEFLALYITWTQGEVIDPTTLNNLKNKGGSDTVTLEGDNQKLNGPYVELVYSTNVNVWGVFTYTDGNKVANEDFYLQAGSSNHKQFLDVFRYNGVGYGMDTSNLRMTSITFTNAELEQTVEGKVKILSLYSQNREIDTENQEIYLTVAQDDGSEMTVGAHLGIGGSLTYLAKSGIYEGVIGGSSGWNKGTVALRTNTNEFDSTNKYKSGSSTSSYSEEPGFYGHATSSKPGDGAVNLINNFDAGRQFQQSWYAEVGGSDEATDGSNGYNRAYCYTGSTAGQYWPYNPVQAGDVVSNPGQIIDYEINEDKGYIYIKARAMDWAKGYDPSNPCENAVEGGVTTKSYVENYYRLNSDGTLVVNNRFIDWNGFTDMDTCGWASTELPACYPVHTLNYYVSNTDGDGTWNDGLEYNGALTSWVGGTAFVQFANSAQGANTKVEDWFAWANGGDENAFGMGVYIPNVNRYTSGRSVTSTSYYTDNNFSNSNAKPVDNYKKYVIFQGNVSQVSDLAQRGNILADKDMLSNMQPIQYTYQSAYVSNTSYTAPGVDYRMEAYVPIEYSYVICLNTVGNIRKTFKDIHDKGTITNAGNGYEKVGLDAWARADKRWTW